MASEHPVKERVALVLGTQYQASGYLLTKRLVLTTAHAIDDIGPMRVAVPGGTREVPCQAVWLNTTVTSDAALLLADQDLVGPDAPWDERPVPFGRMGGIRKPPTAECIGFPLVARHGRRPDTEQFVGVLKTGSHMVAGMYILDGKHAPPRWGRGRQRAWRGMSGAPVFVHGRLVGLAVSVPDNWGEARFGIAPMHVIAADEGFREAYERYTGRGPRLQDVQSGADHLDFEELYAESIVQRYGRLTVFGIDLSRAETGTWPLETAYLSLDVVPGGRYGSGSSDLLGALMEELRRRGFDQPQRVEDALAPHSRVVIRGVAGSGKTTLVQWLATTAAREEFTGPLDTLNGFVPFVLPLRTLARRNPEALPTPAEFLHATGHPRAGSMPPGWIDDVLAAGRGLLLIDGLDEVPQSYRDRTRDWLDDLLAAFPGTRCVLTARPSALPDGWLAGAEFVELALAPMGKEDVRVFVQRWHEAARHTCRDDEEAAELRDFEATLMAGITAMSDLRRLVTNPLMCALVCALNRDRQAHLPHGRRALYDAALQMLLVRRDEQQGIRATEGVELTHSDQVAILQRLAYWLIRNDRSEADQATLRRMIRESLAVLPSLRRAGEDAELLDKVLRHLLGRSGLLREPSVGTVDFVHRTFQDYLGAKAVLDEEDIGQLVKHAHDDLWEDVVRMAVAQGRPKEVRDILRGLVGRGDQEDDYAVRLHLLALACLGDAAQVDPETMQLVSDRSAQHLPPRDNDTIERLVAAGPMVLNQLPSHPSLAPELAEREVRVAGRIGGDTALPILATYATHPDLKVRTAVNAQWPQFEPRPFADQVVVQLIGVGHPVAAFVPAHLDELRRLKQNERVTVSWAADANEIAGRFDLRHLRNVALDRPRADVLAAFVGARVLSQIVIAEPPPDLDLSPLVGEAVSHLTLIGFGREQSASCERLWSDAPVLAGISGLTLRGMHPTTLAPISAVFPDLVRLRIDAPPSIPGQEVFAPGVIEFIE
ncbi:NACHT domain-containing protein [Yinghuangia seranimata]|uniref:NACHT domain-containing protein n=1 Tax=Yinghuangia seranimata TaxID=408067 RepID=UPI00248C45F5|nr:NACHT domain-containing protein [Yinghuangia seranimata]MDI2127206.1 NACHT domain-containing protein [Yinghuangia seranimata]